MIQFDTSFLIDLLRETSSERPGAAFDFKDWLTEVSYRRTRESLLDRGLFVRLEAGSAHLFIVSPGADLDVPDLRN